MLSLFLISGAVLAQPYPDYKSLTVNDYANILPAAEETQLSLQLETLRRETGVEMTVLTLKTQNDYAPDKTLEQFATGLFNHWGIGDAGRNDGVLVLILSDDRAMRIELGAAYKRDWDRVSERVIDDHFLDAFAAGNFPKGITEGTTAIIETIVRPFLQGETPSGNDQNETWIIGILIALFFAFSARKKIGDLSVRLRICPRCGQRSLRQSRSTSVSASKETAGQGVCSRFCTDCDFKEDELYVIPRLSSGSSGSFGGGSSGGGGASGRW
ncbi:YgcG family protein [uncultured Roseobacter sp.]|uniref:TPM domain-containing protein n=1 Tax=uncultured Roseobacter sp. TaxID=114847 RepID=UPI002636ED6C|nr:TPM domain-containing protein [uncultured Roseobacter sp.]